MSARLSDAVFFFDNDKKAGLNAFKDKLKNVLFLEGLGSMFEKSARTQQLADWLCEKLGKNQLKHRGLCGFARLCGLGKPRRV